MNQISSIALRRDPTEPAGPTGQLATWMATLRLTSAALCTCALALAPAGKRERRTITASA